MTPPDQQLELMLSLGDNWDGYGGVGPTPEVVEVAKEFVRLLVAVRGDANLFVSPGRDGGVGVEWDDPAFEYDLDINSDGTLELLREDKQTGAMTTERFSPGRFALPPAILRVLRRLVAA